MRFVVKTRGFREVERKLAEQLPRAVGLNVLRRVARGALEPQADAAAQKAPEERGILAFSIDVSEKRTRRAQSKFPKGRGIEMAMGPAAGLGATYYAAHVEFGTIDTSAQPYMRPTWDSGAHKMLDYVQDHLAAEVEKAIGRASRKLTR